MRSYWLIKSEPCAFSWEEQVRNNVEPWTGVRNHQARRNLETMKAGDRAFFYHSNIGREIVGVVEVVRPAYPDPTAGDPRWVCVDVRTVASMPKPVTLARMKSLPELEDFALIRQSRLSVVPVSPRHWELICQLGHWKD